MRLPTEHEWTWVANFGVRPEGNPWPDPADACDFAVLALQTGLGCGAGTTWPTTSKPRGATAQGVFNLPGNVAEWTSTSSDRGMVVRGGSFRSMATEGGIFARRLVEPDARSPEIGFRCVMSADFTEESLPADNAVTRSAAALLSRPVVPLPSDSRLVRISGGGADLDVDRTEVSRAQFDACMSCSRGGDANGGANTRGASLPVVRVSRTRAAQYCAERGARLPTEAEWEWVALQTSRSGGPWQDPDEACRVAVIAHDIEGEGCGYGGAWPVESSPTGAQDDAILHMAGNVAEWTSSDAAGKAVVRGGDAHSNTLRGTFERKLVDPDVADSWIGFRCVTDLRGDRR